MMMLTTGMDISGGHMINKLIKFSVNNSILIIIIAAFLSIGGFYQFQKLPIDAVPDITNVQVQVNSTTGGLVPEEIERIVTLPIEISLNGIPGVESIRSISRYGISQVTVIFAEDTDIYKARQLVSEKLQGVELPDYVDSQMGPISSGLGEIYHYSVEAKNVEVDKEKRMIQLMELKSIQEWFIKPRLLSVNGVTEINTIGGFEKQFHIQPNIEKMNASGISFNDIEVALEQTNKNVGGGYISQTSEQLLVRGVGVLNNIKDLEDVVVKRLPSYKTIKIKDISVVKLDTEIRTGAGTHNGDEAIIGTAFMTLGENSRVVSIDVHEKLEEIKKTLPEWVELKTLYDRSNMVNATLDTLMHNLLMGAALVILFLILLIGNFRAAIITAIVIPISLMITFILMKYFKISGNLMSLGALDFGIIIDGAVIVVDNCVHRLGVRRRELGRTLTRLEIKNLVIDATTEIRTASGFGELIVIIVFIPLFALTGIEGKMFGPMATTFIFALFGALLLSFTLVPALAGMFLSGDTTDTKPKLLVFAEKIYRPLFDYSMKFKKAVVAIGFAAIALGFILFIRLGAEFIPQLDEGDFAIQFIRPANVTIENSIELQKMSEKVIKSFPQVKDVFARTGAAEVATDPMGVNVSDSYVMLLPKENWPSDQKIKSKADLIEAIRLKLLESVPAQVLMMSQPVELRFNELLEGTRSKVSAKVFGEDLNEITKIATEASEIISKIPGSGEVELESKTLSKILEIKPDYQKISGLGINASPILSAVESAVGGKVVSYLYEGFRKYPIVTRLDKETRSDVLMLEKLPVSVAENFSVELNKVASISYAETSNSIHRENSNRRAAILINPESRDIESFVEKARLAVASELKLPEGHYIEWGGSFKNLIQAKQRLMFLVPLSLIVICLMIYFAFRNVYQVIMIFMCAPMALIGGVIALNVMNIPFSISAGVGFIALIGISILNGVVLVSYINDLLKRGMSIDESVNVGSINRLRPVLMTALTDIFGFLPMIYSTGLGAEVQRPLATVVVGGIISATLLTLLVLPVMYKILAEKMKERNLKL